MPASSLFAPRSIAVFGASSDPARIGGRPIAYLRRAGYKGGIYPVNPNRDVVQDLPSYPSLGAVPQIPDVAVIALPANSVLPTVESCVRAGVPWVVVFTAGFAESGPEGRELQTALSRVVSGTGTRLIGPNSNGVMGVAAGAFMCLTPLLDDFLPEVGQIAVVTQSAAVGTSYVLAQLVARRLGVRYWIHTGNEADVTAADALDWFLEDSRVRSIILAFESLRELGRVTDAIERAASRGIVISTLRTARSPAGRVAAESHTAALIGRRSLVMEGACLQAGAYFGDSVHDLVDAAEGSLWIRPLRGKRVGVLTSSGGVGVMIADAVSEAGLKLPSPSAELRERLLSIAPYCHPANPVDATAQVINDPEVFGGLLNAMVESGEYDLLAVFLARAKLSDPRTRQLAEIAGRGRTAGHRVRICVTGFIWPDCLDLLHASGVAVFAEPIGMARALSGLERVRFGRRARPRIVASSPVRDLAGRLRTVAESGLVGELDSKQFLRDYGLTVIADCVASTPAEAVSAAAEVGYPVALKVSAAGLAHKAHAGGVRLGLRTATEVRAAARQLLRLELGAAPAGDGRRTLLVEPMRAGIEMFVGLTADPEVGPVVVCGWGGTSVETESRVAMRRLPVTRRDVDDILAQTGIGAALGARASRSAAALLNELNALSRFWQDAGDCLRAIDLNPVIVDAHGSPVVVDALIELNIGGRH